MRLGKLIMIEYLIDRNEVDYTIKISLNIN